jgi:hypothetical protein
MILIYSDSQIIDQEWLPRIQFNQPYTICHSYEEYAASTAETKIAFTTHRLHCDYDQDCPAYVGFEDKINHLSAISKLVFTFESELHNFHWQIWEKCHHPNVYWVIAGVVNDREDINQNIIYWGDWFKTPAYLYKQLPHKLAELEPYTVKPMFFDALLGSPKPHRDFIYNAVKSNGLQDKIVMTYGGQWQDDDFYAKDYFIWEPGTVPVGQIIGTADWVDYCGVRTGLSRVIPIKVYNDCAYSIIAETDFDNTLSFWSEKTAKPFMARKLFIAFTGYKFLENLRKLGFQTFGSIIDESYDLEADDEKRYAMAFEQVKWLCNQPQAEIYAKLQPIAEHNFKLVMERDWTDYSAKRIESVVNSAIN